MTLPPQLAAHEFHKGSKKKPPARKAMLKRFLHRHHAKPNPKAPLGQGGRFAAVQASAAKSGATDPAAVAAAVGRKKFGNAQFQAMAQKGKGY